MATERKPVTPERAAQLREAKARQRTRDAAVKFGVDVPAAAAKRREGRYNPRNDLADVASVARRAERARDRYDRAVAELADVRGNKTNLFVGRDYTGGRVQPERKTPAGRARQIQAIKAGMTAKSLTDFGRAKRAQLLNELDGGPAAELLKGSMTPEQQARFRELSAKIAKTPYKALALTFKNAGGASDLAAVYDAILASEGARDVEGGLAKLEELAKVADKARTVYTTKTLKTVGL